MSIRFYSQYLILLLFVTLSHSISSQASFTKTTIDPIVKLGTVDVKSLNDKYQVTVINTESQDATSHVIKQRLQATKEAIKTLYPKNDNPIVDLRGSLDPPQLLDGYWGHLFAPGIPLDNHLATNGEQVLIAMNTHFSMKNLDGSPIIGFSLDHFAADVGLEGNTFDPRVLYDPQTDRYIGVFLHGSESSDTGIGIMFSVSNDITGDWVVYALPGNPFSNTTWTDYPMITVTDTDLLITVNLIRDAEPWETGFDETIIWQLDKQNGYNGEDMNSVLWQDLAWDGKNIRNLCPMESADAEPEPNAYFLSNRNFDMENDTFFFVEMTGGIDDPSAELKIETLISPTPYGAPPNAAQSVGALQTNDARVLEGYYHNGEIQFVGNTRNLDNNKAGIYHGTISDVLGEKSFELQHIIPADLEIGYPGITYTGIDPDDRDAIIHFSHTSETVFAGVSAMYYDPEFGYSDIVVIREGDGYIDILNGDVERWGDYAGSQREFLDPGLCFISGTLGVPSKHNRPWVARLARPDFALSSVDLNSKTDVNLFPNPVNSRVTVELNIPQSNLRVQALLYDNSGRVIEQVYNGIIRKSGETELSFETSHLAKGNYTVHLMADGKNLTSKSFVKQ